jgi:hypothetical protein
LSEEIVKENIIGQTSMPTFETIEKMGLGSNEIIDIISPDRSHVIAAIHVLIKEKFLRQRKKWKQGYSKKIRPTALGFEVLKLIEDIAAFDKTNRDLFPAIRIWQDKFREESFQPVLMEQKKRDSPLKDEDYQKITNYSKDEFRNLQSYHNRLNTVQSMFNSFLLTIIIFRFIEISYRYRLTRTGTEILQKIVMDQISSFLENIITRSGFSGIGVKDKPLDSNLNSLWRQMLYNSLASKILDDMYNYYAIDDVTIDEVLRTGVKDTFCKAINLLNTPPVLIEAHLNAVKRGFYGSDSRSEKETVEDLKTILTNSQLYLKNYSQYLEAFSNS